MPTTVCPTFIGTIPSIGVNDLALDYDNGWLYVNDTGTGIKRYTYPALTFDSTIVTDPSVSGLAIDDTGTVYYATNDGTGGDTEVIKLDGGPTILANFGTDGAFGLTWHPVDGLLYLALQRVVGGTQLSILITVDTVTGADVDVDLATPPTFVTPAAPQGMPDGSVWYFSTNIVYRYKAGTRQAASADSGLNGNLTVVPTNLSTALLNHASGDREYGPGNPSTSSAYSCTLSNDVLGASYTPDWSRAVFTPDGFTIYELVYDPAGNPWTVGRVRWGDTTGAWH